MPETVEEAVLRVRAIDLDPLRGRMEALAAVAGLVAPGPFLYSLLAETHIAARAVVGCAGVFCVITAIGLLLAANRLRVIRAAHRCFLEPRVVFSCMAACAGALLTFASLAGGAVLIPALLGPPGRAIPGEMLLGAAVAGLLAIWPAMLIRECFQVWRRTNLEEHELPASERRRLREARRTHRPRGPDHTPVPYAPGVRFLDEPSA